MKPVALLVVAVVLFGSSAGVSWFLQSKMKKPAAADEAKAKQDAANEKVLKEPDISHAPPKKEAKEDSHGKAPSLYIPGGEELVQGSLSIKAQLDAIKVKEKKLEARQFSITALHEDMKKERASLDDLRKQIDQEAKALSDKLLILEKKATDTQSERQKIADHNKELKQTLFEIEEAEKLRVVQLGKVLAGMPPEAAGKTLMALAESGKMEMAVKVLASMNEGKIAKILAETGDEAFTAQLFEKINRLKAVPKPKE